VQGQLFYKLTYLYNDKFLAHEKLLQFKRNSISQHDLICHY
jgi:hypothetical protein